MLRFRMDATHRKHTGNPSLPKVKSASALLLILQRSWGSRTEPEGVRHHHPRLIDFLSISFALLILIIFFEANCNSAAPLLKELGYPDDAIVLIVNADDVGLHPDETDATIQAMKQGMVTSGSIMVPCPDFNRTIDIWEKNPELDFGIHLTLTCEWGHLYPWVPILPKDVVPSLFSKDGLMWPNVESLVQHARVNEALMEAEAQIRKVLAFGVQPTHLDAHMNWYTANSDYFKGIMQLAQRYHLPMRVWQRRRTRLPWWPNDPAEMRRKGFVFPDSQASFYNINGEDEKNGLRQERYLNFLNSLHPGIHEVAIHLAFKTAEIETFMGPEDVAHRTRDYDIWTDQATRAIIQNRKIILIGFRELQKLQEKRWPLNHSCSIMYGSLPRFANHPWK